MWRYGILTDTNECFRVDDNTGIPYKYKNGQWVESLDLAGIYSDDIPTKPMKKEEVWKRLGLQN